MPVATFDTLKFANALKAAGVPEKQAEAEAAALAEVLQVNLKELVTKEDQANTKAELKRDIDALRKDLKQEIKDVEQRLISRLDTIVEHHKGEMLLLKWMFGVLPTACVGILIRLFLIRGPI